MQKKLSISLVASVLLATTNLFSAQQLDTITVTSATKTTQSIKDVTSNIDVITSEEIEAKHFTTVSEALNTLPGIDVVSSGGIGQLTNVYLRGMNSRQVLVLVDGIRNNDPTNTSGATFDHLMIGDIERIEIIKGAQSSIWGAEASAGVINIITKSSKKGTHGSIGVEYGSFNTKKVNALISHKEKNFDAKLNISKLDTDGFSAVAPRGKDVSDFEDDGYSNISANLKLGYNFNDENKINASYGIIDAKTDYDDFGSTATEANTQNKSKTQNKFTSLNYENINTFATTNIYFNKSIFDREYIEPLAIWTPIKRNYNGKTDEYGIKSTIPYLNNSSFVTVGADYKEFEHKNQFNKSYNSKATYLTNSNKFNNDNTIITESIRFDSYDKFDNKITGKIGIKQYIIDDLNVSSNYGTGYNVPTIFELYDTGYGNENLKPEETKGYDLQVEYKGLSATYFDNEIENMYGYDSVTYQSINVDGKSKLKGYEFAYKKDLIEDLFINLAYTKLSAKNKDGEYLGRRAKDSLKYGLDYYGISKLNISVFGEYIGSRFDGTNEQGAKTGNYTLWNTVVNYEINKTFSTYLKVDNLFNKYYQTVDGYATAERSAYVGLKASF